MRRGSKHTSADCMHAPCVTVTSDDDDCGYDTMVNYLLAQSDLPYNESPPTTVCNMPCRTKGLSNPDGTPVVDSGCDLVLPILIFSKSSSKEERSP